MLCRGVPASSEVIYVEICEKMSFLLTFLQFHAIMCGLIEISTQFLGQFWYTKLFPRSHFSFKASYLYCAAFVFKSEISPGFLLTFHTWSLIYHT